MVRAAVSSLMLCMMLAVPAAADDLTAFVDVAGAPGDGEKALYRALSNQLLNRGFTITGTPAANAYEIQGTVKVSPAKRGKESVRIDWTVFGPQGERLGVVTQVKVIRKGSLDRRWGAAADAAADAAAQDILKLLPQ